MAISFDPQEFDDVEIVISRTSDGNGYMANVLLPDVGQFYMSDIGPLLSRLPPLPIHDLEGAPNPRVYGEMLSQWLFQDKVAEAFSYAYSVANEPSRGLKLGARIRLRLSLDSQSSELHHLCWESLYARDGDKPLSLSTAFSRFMRVGHPRARPIQERPLRMLLVISNPEKRDQFAIDKIDPDLEKSLIKEATRPLGPLLQLDRLRGTPSLDQIRASMKRGYHIVHLIAPTAFHDNHGYLILPNEAGQAQEVPIEDVVHAIVSTSYPPPGLVFLTVPLVAGEQGRGTMVSLAQMLIEAGVQALVAIQPPIIAPDMLRFTERFYAVLMHTGVIDVAMAEARTEIYYPESWEWTYPVLYMRVSDGRLFQPLPETLEGTMSGISINRIGD